MTLIQSLTIKVDEFISTMTQMANPAELAELGGVLH